MRNLKLTLSYDGTDFSGWQTQPGYRTVQETLEKAIAALNGSQLGGRTLNVNEARPKVERSGGGGKDRGGRGGGGGGGRGRW